MIGNSLLWRTTTNGMQSLIVLIVEFLIVSMTVHDRQNRSIGISLSMITICTVTLYQTGYTATQLFNPILVCISGSLFL